MIWQRTLNNPFITTMRGMPRTLKKVKKWGRYVHVIGAAWSDTLEASQRTVGLTLESERYSYVYVKELLQLNYGSAAIENVTIHEVGHQFAMVHQHQDDANGITEREKLAIANNDTIMLTRFRSNGLMCVMEPTFTAQNDTNFCPFHRGILRNYTGW